MLAIFVMKAGKTTEQLAPILPMMTALAQTEAVVLGEESSTASRVQFSAVDGSSLQLPVDRQLGSDKKQLEVIEALKTAKEVLQGVTKDALPILEDLSSFLKDPDSYSECAAAISTSYSYPVQRVKSVVEVPVHDIGVLQRRVRALHHEPLTPLRGINALSFDEPLKFIECTLAERVGLAIRYYLRLLFNPVPPASLKFLMMIMMWRSAVAK